MREILFRGKRTEGCWLYGDLRQWSDSKKGIRDRDLKSTIAVIPDTVGQYTGLTDRNGTKIFEGDIVRYNTYNDFDCHSAVKFGEYEQDGSAGEYHPKDCIGWYVEVDNFTCHDWAEDDPIYFEDYLTQQNLFEVSDECEVIGNIHDNPELIGGKEDGE